MKQNDKEEDKHAQGHLSVISFSRIHITEF